MGVLQELRRWYSLNHGDGKEMLDAGAEVVACPHCEEETPVYRSAYDDFGHPVTFTACLWCEGLIEYRSPAVGPHPPFTTPREMATRPRPPKRPAGPRRSAPDRQRSAPSTARRSPRDRGTFYHQSHVFRFPQVRF